MSKETPLIWTTHGNLPLDSVKQEIEWRVTEDNTIFIERYTLNGEVVKESSHIHVNKGAEALGTAST